MSETIAFSIGVHLIAIFITLFLAIYLILNAFLQKDFIKFYNRQKYLYPQFNVLIGAIFFTGIIVMAMNQFNVRYQVWIMIIFFVYMMVMNIKLKRARRTIIKNDIISYKNFRNFVKKKYLFDIVGLIFVYIITK